jgi:hypothetical protein
VIGLIQTYEIRELVFYENKIKLKV